MVEFVDETCKGNYDDSRIVISIKISNSSIDYHRVFVCKVISTLDWIKSGPIWILHIEKYSQKMIDFCWSRQHHTVYVHVT